MCEAYKHTHVYTYARNERIRDRTGNFHLYFLLIGSSPLRIFVPLGTRQMHSNLHATSVTGNTSHHVTRDPVFYPKCVSSKTSCTDHADEGRRNVEKGVANPLTSSWFSWEPMKIRVQTWNVVNSRREFTRPYWKLHFLCQLTSCVILILIGK